MSDHQTHGPQDDHEYKEDATTPTQEQQEAEATSDEAKTQSEFSTPSRATSAGAGSFLDEKVSDLSNPAPAEVPHGDDFLNGHDVTTDGEVEQSATADSPSPQPNFSAAVCFPRTAVLCVLLCALCEIIMHKVTFPIRSFA